MKRSLKDINPMRVAHTEFALKLLRKIADRQESVVFSPSSVSIALVVLCVGAEGETKQELLRLLGDGSTETKVRSFYSEALNLAKEDEGMLNGVSKICLKHGYAIKSTFKETMATTYNNCFEEKDFDNAKQTAKEINAFVEQFTKGEIADVVSEGQVESSRMLVMNAVSFNAEWEHKFWGQVTYEEIFYASPGVEKWIDMMGYGLPSPYSDQRVPYTEDDSVRVLGLPYEGEEMYMFIVLPKKRYGLDDILSSLDYEKLAKFFTTRKKRLVSVDLPQFKIESSLSFKEILPTLGAGGMFSDNANFEGITTEKPLFVDDFIHTAIIETGEKGTRRAALMDAPIVGGVIPRHPTKFKANHPFLYAVVNNKGHIHFMGIFRG